MKTIKSIRWSWTQILLSTILILHCTLINFCKAQTNQQDYCYSDEKDPYVQFGAKSAYELFRAQKFTPIPSCKPVMVWGSIRHGTRYPSKETMERMKTLTDVRDQIIRNHEENREGRLCAKDLQLLKNWTYVLSPAYEDKLSTQGKDDLRLLGQRIRTQYNSIFDSYSSEKFSFYNDGTPRTAESAQAFIDGFFGIDHDHPRIYENSSLLKSPDSCQAWVTQVKNNTSNQREYQLFRESQYIQKLISDVNRRLGFRNNLTLDIIELMYDMCRYGKAWYIASRPPFCTVFSKNNLQVLEYMEDLKYYYDYSNGNDLNKRLACPLVSDMFSRFRDIAEGRNKSGAKPVGVFYVSHSGLHVPSLAFLNIRLDSNQLLHDNYEAMLRREFMTSQIDPFSANLMAVFYKCVQDEENRVMFYLNEFPIRHPDCEGALCSWKTLYNKYKANAEPNSCNFDFCTTGHANRLASSVSWLSTMAGVILGTYFISSQFL